MDRRYDDTPWFPEPTRRLADVNKSRPESQIQPDDQTGALLVAPAAVGPHGRSQKERDEPVEPRDRQ